METSTISKHRLLPLTANTAATPNEFAKRLSIVIVGKDTRQKGSSLNTDVIMVVVLSPKDKKITMVSISRDTKVKIPGYERFYKGYRQENADLQR
ncbi:LCP family protein [Brevibacillus laterosporus]|uniref:LCP family glycopolymer transferase n=1 Tax=Brevibacillus laterosporus TaxID=1465 RepID=UPI003D229113